MQASLYCVLRIHPLCCFPAVAETMGGAGFQLFVDVGQPVDDSLVSALVQEVILEKIRGMVGQTGIQTDPDVAPLRPKPTTTFQAVRPASPKQATVQTLDQPPQVDGSFCECSQCILYTV